MVGGSDAILVVDDTALPKKGDRSVGVAPQYATTLGKTANCQTLVSLTLAGGEVPVAVGLRLFLPESWTGDPGRMASTGVPEDRRAARTKLEIAIAEIDRVREAGTRFGWVLADAGYGCSAPFRQALSERGLRWAVGITGRNKVYPADVAMIFPVTGRGRPRQRHVPDQVAIPHGTREAPEPRMALQLGALMRVAIDARQLGADRLHPCFQFVKLQVMPLKAVWS